MPATSSTQEIRQEQGFALYVLRSSEVELAVVPELGARILSLKNLRSGREWLWHRDSGLKLFRNQPGDDFARSTLAGVDECFPTIAPCSWQGRALPDHGELWSVPWHLDDAQWNAGVLKTSVALSISPFIFQRRIRLEGNLVRMSYQATNRSGAEEAFLWSMHPLLRLKAGDQLDLPGETRALLNGHDWVDAVDTAVPSGGCSKVFARPLRKGRAEIRNPGSGDGLVFEWNPAENNTLGLWLTRGGWHGHHHLALEPTNGGPDSLACAAAQGHCRAIPAFGSMSWSVTLQLNA